MDYANTGMTNMCIIPGKGKVDPNPINIPGWLFIDKEYISNASEIRMNTSRPIELPNYWE